MPLASGYDSRPERGGTNTASAYVGLNGKLTIPLIQSYLSLSLKCFDDFSSLFDDERPTKQEHHQYRQAINHKHGDGDHVSALPRDEAALAHPAPS